jgi:hypothetical protein
MKKYIDEELEKAKENIYAGVDALYEIDKENNFHVKKNKIMQAVSELTSATTKLNKVLGMIQVNIMIVEKQK